MIQRIQSIFLLSTIVVLVILSFGTPLLSFQSLEFNYVLSATSLKKFDANEILVQTDSIPFYIVSLGLIILTFFSMILYKNLKRQLSLVRLTTLLYFIAMVALGFISFLGNYFTGEEQHTTSYSFGFYFFIIGFILLLLASSGIKKDKKLIESVDRIR
ncbi:MAG: DUF4293 family protein [Crocinitomicaceae bacterium]|nr:DUF4293 family protein [Crocinitomicaceae bacterium]